MDKYENILAAPGSIMRIDNHQRAKTIVEERFQHSSRTDDQPS